MPNKSHYNKNNRMFARRLRQEGTRGETILWAEVLSGRKFYGYQFNRQFPIDDFIVDFICRKLRLIIEVDGYSHQFKVDEDRLRDRQLETLGYRIIRIPESDVRNDLRNVIRLLESYLPT